MSEPGPNSERSRRRRSLRSLARAATVVACCHAAMLAAAEHDPNQPADIESDRAELDRDEGISRYFGNVEFIQGELRITADRMVITAPGGELEQAEADGEPARVFHRTSDGERLRARGRNIVYDPAEPLITLTGSARVERGDDDFSAATIRYAPDTGRVEGERDDDERVRITIQPGDDAEDGGDDGEDQADDADDAAPEAEDE